MTLLTPVAFGLTALTAPIVLMYILKLRRQPKVISSTFLWSKALDDVQANAPWQRLRITALLILQLLALMALVIVQTRPAYSSTERFHGDLILVLDQSFGMQATDVKPNRFAAAQTEAKKLATQVASGNVVSVIGMAAQPTLAIAEGTDQGSIDTAIDGLSAGYSPPNFLETLSLASSLARSGQPTKVIVLTSRESGISTLPVPVTYSVQIVRIGGNLRDLGITALGATSGRGLTSALVRVQDYGYTRRASNLNLYVDNQLFDVRPLTLGPGSQSLQFWQDIPSGSKVLHAVLTSPDDVTADKQAWATVSNPETRRVLLVTSSDYFVQTALQVNPDVVLATESPAHYFPAQALHFDAVIFDGFVPASLPPAPTMIVSPPKSQVGRIRFGAFATAGPLVADGGQSSDTQPIQANVEVSDVVVAQARATTLPSTMLPIFSAGSVPVLEAGEIGNNRVAIGTFSLHQSNWPLRVSFPIVIQNLLQFLVPSVGVSATDITAGDPVTLAPEPGVTKVDVTLPNGSQVTLHRPFVPFTNTAMPGVYTVREVGRRFTVHFVANLLPARPARATGPRVITLGRSTNGQEHRTSSPNELGWIAALACLALLAGEWFVAFRR